MINLVQQNNALFFFQDVVRNIGDTAVNRTNATPINQVMIIDCGLNDLDSKYTLTDQQSMSDNDI